MRGGESMPFLLRIDLLSLTHIVSLSAAPSRLMFSSILLVSRTILLNSFGVLALAFVFQPVPIFIDQKVNSASCYSHHWFNT